MELYEGKSFNFDKLNRRHTVREGIATENMEFRPLKDFCGKNIKCDGFFFTDGKYGRQVVIVGNGYLINMPSRAVEQFEQINEDVDALNAVLSGGLVLTDIKMVNTRNGMTTAYTLTNA